jgi:hypothetical protein
MTLGQLAESVQGRWDANDNAQKALAQAKAAAAQAHRDAQKSIKQSLRTQNATTLSGITSLLGQNNGKGGTYNAEDLSRMIQTAFGVDSNYSNGVLNYLGIPTPTTSFSISVNEPTGKEIYDYILNSNGGE